MEENKTEKKFFATSAGKAVLIAIFYAIILILIVIAVNLDLEYLTIAIGIACAIPAWKFLSKITPNVFLIMPIVGWLIYFLVKGVLAIGLGVFVAPYSLAKTISERVQENL